MKPIIFFSRKIEKYDKYKLIYSLKEYINTRNLFKEEKIVMHKFIEDIFPKYDICYNIDLHYTVKVIEIFAPFRAITKSDVLFDYEYYNNEYKTNNRARLINKKYVIDYFAMGMFDPDKENSESKKIELVCTFRF